jgi:hypothetical protein
VSGNDLFFALRKWKSEGSEMTSHEAIGSDNLTHNVRFGGAPEITYDIIDMNG